MDAEKLEAARKIVLSLDSREEFIESVEAFYRSLSRSEQKSILMLAHAVVEAIMAVELSGKEKPGGISAQERRETMLS